MKTLSRVAKKLNKQTSYFDGFWMPKQYLSAQLWHTHHISSSPSPLLTRVELLQTSITVYRLHSNLTTVVSAKVFPMQY